MSDTISRNARASYHATMGVVTLMAGVTGLYGEQCLREAASGALAGLRKFLVDVYGERETYEFFQQAADEAAEKLLPTGKGR